MKFSTLLPEALGASSRTEGVSGTGDGVSFFSSHRRYVVVNERHWHSIHAEASNCFLADRIGNRVRIIFVMIRGVVRET